MKSSVLACAIYGGVMVSFAFSLQVAPRQSHLRQPAQRWREPPSQSNVDKSEECVTSVSRRTHLRTAFASFGAIALPLMASPSSCQASDGRLFRPNPLTNRALEQLRIWDQAEADEMKYGGELERGDFKLSSMEEYARLLVPILRVADELEQVDALLHQDGDDAARLARVQQTLAQTTYEKIKLKRIFNSFADNIYYSDPDRANAYLAGGAVPSSQQSLAYLLRNDLLTAVESLQAEVAFLREHTDESREDLYQFSQQAVDAMKEYLRLVPPKQIETARALMASTA